MIGDTRKKETGKVASNNSIGSLVYISTPDPHCYLDCCCVRWQHEVWWRSSSSCLTSSGEALGLGMVRILSCMYYCSSCASACGLDCSERWKDDADVHCILLRWEGLSRRMMTVMKERRSEGRGNMEVMCGGRSKRRCASGSALRVGHPYPPRFSAQNSHP